MFATVQQLIRAIQPKNNEFFVMLEGIAMKVEELSLWSDQSLASPEGEGDLPSLKEIERDVDHRVFALQLQLAETYATPIDRVDIEHLALELKQLAHDIYAVTETRVTFGMADLGDYVVTLRPLIRQSVTKIMEMTQLMAKSSDRPRIAPLVREVVEMERQGDRERNAKLHSLVGTKGSEEVISAGVLRSFLMIDALEKALDQCRGAAQAIGLAATRAL